MNALLGKFFQDDGAEVSLEYGLLGLILAVGIIGTISLIAPELNAYFFDAAAPL